MDIDVGARQILQTMERRRYWESKSISIDTLKNHYCQDVLTFEQSLTTLIEKGLVQKVSNKVVSLNIKKRRKLVPIYRNKSCNAWNTSGTREIVTTPDNGKSQLAEYV